MNVNNPIALVEDNPDDALLMKRALKKAGVTNPLVVLEDGQQAIDYFAGVISGLENTAPAYVLLDIKLPYKDGHEVLAWIKGQELLQCIPITMLTSSSDNRDIRKAYSLGAHSYLVKPDSTDKLLEMSIAFKNYWLTHNHLPSREKHMF